MLRERVGNEGDRSRSTFRASIVLFFRTVRIEVRITDCFFICGVANDTDWVGFTHGVYGNASGALGDGNCFGKCAFGTRDFDAVDSTVAQKALVTFSIKILEWFAITSPASSGNDFPFPVAGFWGLAAAVVTGGLRRN